MNRSIRRRIDRAAGRVLTRVVPVRLRAGTCGGVGVDRDRLAERVGWLIDLVVERATVLLGAHWDAASMAAYAGTGGYAYKAWASSFSWPAIDKTRYLPSRVTWMGLETSGRTLRSSSYRRDIVEALLSGSDLPRDADVVSVRNVRRRIEKHERKHRSRPVSFLVLEPEHPRVARQALLSVVDRQLAELRPGPDGGHVLHVLLPMRSDPRGQGDWAWRDLPFVRPAHAVGGQVLKPTPRIKDGKVMADVPVERPAPAPTGDPLRVLGLDWGVGRPLAGAVAWIEDGKVVTDGRPLHLAAGGLLARAGRLHGPGQRAHRADRPPRRHPAHPRRRATGRAASRRPA